MRTRKHPVQVYLDETEWENFRRNVFRTGLSQSDYLRKIIRGITPREKMPADFYTMKKELYKIGTNLNQIARKAHKLDVIDVQRYDEAVRELEKLIQEITRAVILPEEK